MPLPPGDFIADAHEDLAYHCQENGRDLSDPGAAVCMITLPWLERCGVRLVCATLFTPTRQSEAERRYKLAGQVEMYREWFERFKGRLVPVLAREDLARLAEARPARTPEGIEAYPVGVILLMEGLDMLASDSELATWHARGVRMASITWDGSNRFASGTFSDGRGLKPEGFRLLGEFERLGMILDVSHLTDAGIEDVLKSFNGPLCASHSNSRLLCPIERNLADDYALAVRRRGGMVGLNLLAPLLTRPWQRGDPLPSIAQAVSHTEHFAKILGRGSVGLGSDLDGGLDPGNTPEGIDRVDHLPKLGEELKRRGWSELQVAGFMGANWWRFFERNLPQTV